MELSRGASHIASMLYEQSTLAAVRETILEFEASHARDDLRTFAHALLRRLEQRGNPAAGKGLRAVYRAWSSTRADTQRSDQTCAYSQARRPKVVKYLIKEAWRV